MKDGESRSIMLLGLPLSQKNSEVGHDSANTSTFRFLGDLLARWSNDTIKSTVHRVVQPPTTAEIHPARYTIPYFCHPNHDSLIDAIPGTFGEDKPKKYQAVNW